MKNILTLSIMLLLFAACKSRKVAIKDTDSTSVHSAMTQSSNVAKGIDTTKSRSTTTLKQTKTIKLRDSSGTVTAIKPVPGTISTVDAKGTFTGQATSIKTTRHETKQKDAVVTSDLQQKQGEIKGIDTTKVLKAIAMTTDSTAFQQHVKDIDAKADHSWAWVAIGCVLVVVGALFAYFKFKPV